MLNKSSFRIVDDFSLMEEEDYKNLDKDKQKIVQKLLYIFTFYSAKSSKFSYKQLNEKYYMKLMTNIWEVSDRAVSRNGLLWKQIANTYHSIGRKHGITFKQFLQILPTVSVFFQPEFQRQEAVKKLINAILYIYHEDICKQIEGQVVEYDDTLSQQTQQFLLNLVPDLLTVYKIFFANEISNKFSSKDHKNQSFQKYLLFMKEFDVYPKLISASNLYFIYNYTIKSQEDRQMQNKMNISPKGKIFTFISRVSLCRLKHIENPENWQGHQKDILRTLLQYMETIRLTKKKETFKFTRFTFIVYSQYPEEVIMKTFLVKDKLVTELEHNMKFFDILQNIEI